MAKTYDKAKWLEDSKVRVETAKKALEEGLAALQTTEDWVRTLKAMAALGPARLGRLSFRNSILVLLERPDARHVATFGTWRKLGRSVVKGSKAPDHPPAQVRSDERPRGEPANRGGSAKRSARSNQPGGPGAEAHRLQAAKRLHPPDDRGP